MSDSEGAMQPDDLEILVIEPEPAGALYGCLRDAGGAVLAARGYGDGLSKLGGRTAAARAVIIDVRTGLMEGLEFIESVRAGSNAADPATPIVAVARSTQVHAFRAALGDAIDGCLASPVSATALRRALCAALDPRRVALVQAARRRAAAATRFSPSAPSSSGT